MVTKRKVLTELLKDAGSGLKCAAKGWATYSKYPVLWSAGEATVAGFVEGAIYSAAGLTAGLLALNSPYTDLTLLGIPITMVGRGLHYKYSEKKAELTAREELDA